MKRSKAESLITYLNEMERMKRVKPAAGDGTIAAIMVALAGGRHLTLTELLSESRMSVAEFPEALKGLQGATFVKVNGEPGHEVAELTSLGEDVAELINLT